LRKFPTSDLSVFKQVCVDNEYSLLIDLVKAKLPSGKITMIDGGANIGLTSIALKVNLSPSYDIEVFLVEPFDENIEQINKNIELQKIDSFTVFKAGITNKPGYLDLDYKFRDSLEWSVQVKESLYETQLIAIEICQILDQAKWNFVDILKLDIEGAESNLFQDRNYAKMFLSRVRLIAIEIHKEYISEEVVLEILRDEGFHMTPHGELHIGYNNNLLP
jgi:FkbM family methyltransferase